MGDSGILYSKNLIKVKQKLEMCKQYNKSYISTMTLCASLVRLKRSLQTKELQLAAAPPQPVKHPKQCVGTHTCTAYWCQLFDWFREHA